MRPRFDVKSGVTAVAAFAAVMTCAFLTSSWRLSAQAPTRRVLVMPFAADVQPGAAGGPAAAHWLGEAAAVLIGEGLTTAGVTAFSRDERLAAFDRLQLPSSAVLTRATMIRVGELLGASEIIFGDVRLAGDLTVRTRVIDVLAGREAPELADRAPLPDIIAAFDRVSRRVAAAAGRSVPAGTPLIRVMPYDAFENYMKGLVAVSPAAQQRLLESAMATAPKDARVLTALWSVYTTQGAHDKALAAANAVPADSPLARKARFDVALSLVELKRLDGAYRELVALQSARRSAVLANALGVVQLRRTAPADTQPATTHFSQAVEGEPGNTDFLFNLGYAYALAGNSSSALLWLRESVRYDAANGDAHLVMSAVLAAAGRTAEAQRELDLARALGTRQEILASAPPARVPPGLERLEVDLDHPGLPRVSAALATPAQTDQHETAAFHLSQARSLVAAHQDRDAGEALRRAIYLAPYEEEPHRLLGAIYQRAGRLPEAIDEFKVALWCRETAAGHAALGQAYLDTGDRAGAERELDRALALAPDSADARALQKRIGG